MKHVFHGLVPALLAAALFLFGSSARAEGGMKIAVVDVQRAVAQTEDGLRATATLKKVFDSKQQELNKKQQDLQKQREDIEKQSKVLSKEALQKRVDDWQKAMVELQGVFVEYNKELEKRQKEMTDPIFEKILGIVKRLATTEGYDVIVDKQAVPYVRGDLDLTDRCIQMYNGGGAGAAPAPGGGAAPAPGTGGAAPKK